MYHDTIRNTSRVVTNHTALVAAGILDSGLHFSSFETAIPLSAKKMQKRCVTTFRQICTVLLCATSNVHHLPALLPSYLCFNPSFAGSRVTPPKSMAGSKVLPSHQAGRHLPSLVASGTTCLGQIVQAGDPMLPLILIKICSKTFTIYSNVM